MKKTALTIATFLAIVISACHNIEDYDFDADRTEEVIYLSFPITPTDTTPEGNPKRIKEISQMANGGFSPVLTARIAGDAAEGKRTVIFETTSGVFERNGEDSISVIALPEGPESPEWLLATVRLKSVSTDTALITARIEGYQDTAMIVYQRQCPTGIRAIPGTFSFQTSFDTSYLVAAQLYANDKLPSEGVSVKMEVWTVNPYASIGEFQDVETTSDATGKVTAKFSAGNVSSGDARFIVKVVSDSVCSIEYADSLPVFLSQ